MIENILYKKSYKHMTDEDYKELFASVTPERLKKMEEYIDKFKKNRKYVKIPEKNALMRAFVQGAINFSNDMFVDVEITHRDDCIDACFSFEDIEVFTSLKDVISLSDEIFICQNRKSIELILSFKTHITELKNG